MSKTALILGATGLVGTELVQLLCHHQDYDKVICLSRRALAWQHPKLTQYIVDFTAPETWQHLVQGDVVYCALGTTIKQAGSKQAQKDIDLTLPLAIAQVARKNDITAFALVSSTGADADSSSFYLSLKGQLEQGLMALEFTQLTIVQPSILTGQRAEFRFGERVAHCLLTLFHWMPGVREYQPISGHQVAKALIHFHQENRGGVTIKKRRALFI